MHEAFAHWSLDAIRDEGACLSWLEEQRFEWVSPTANAIEDITNGKTIILVTDKERKWLERYILSNINKIPLQRPPISIVSIYDIFLDYNELEKNDSFDMLSDMIKLTYQDNYFFWYIGRGDDKRADLPKTKDDTYFWILDENYLNSFKLNSYDKDLDIKLIQLFKLFNASLEAVMFGEIDVS